MDRRTMLKLGGLGLLGLGLDGCSGRASSATLPRVFASWDRVIRTSVGLRPFRPKGIRLGSEEVGDKLVVHNYGHGGGGVSLSWGTGRLAALEAARSGERTVAVLGAGAVGLATARQLQRLGFDVTIYTRAVWPDPSVCSGHAPARFTPGSAIIDPTHRTLRFDAMYERAAGLSYRYWHDLVGTGYGVSWKYAYSLREESRPAGERGPSSTGVGAGVELGPGEHPFRSPYAFRRVVLVVDTPVFLDATLRDFRRWGGDLVIRTFRGPDDVMELAEPVVVNCTGLGAFQVWEDRSMEPLKGQLVLLVPQPEVDFVVSGGGFSMVPRSTALLLGGPGNSPNDWTMEPNPEAERLVVERAMEVFGDMRTASRSLGSSVPAESLPSPDEVRFSAEVDLGGPEPPENPQLPGSSA